MSITYTLNVIYARDARAAGAVSSVLANAAAAQAEVAAAATLSVGSGGDYPTWAAYRAAVGDAQVLGAQTVTVLGDLGPDDPLTFPRVGPAGAWVVQGQKTLLRSGTLTGGTAAYQAGPPAVAGVAEDTSIPVSWEASGLVGKLAENTTVGSWTVVMASLSAKRARIGPKRPLFGPFSDAWSSGHAYSVWDRPAVSVLSGAADVAPGGSIVVRDLDVADGFVACVRGPEAAAYAAAVVFERCALGTMTGVFDAVEACSLLGATFGQGSDVTLQDVYFLPNGAGGVIQSSGAMIVSRGLAQESSLVVAGGSAYVDLAGFDAVPGYPVLYVLGGAVVASDVAGSGGTSYGVSVANAYQLVYYATPSAAGSGGELQLGATSYTWAVLGASPTGLTDANWARAVPA